MDEQNNSTSNTTPTDTDLQAAGDLIASNSIGPTDNEPKPNNHQPASPPEAVDNLENSEPEETLSQQEKLRLAKIAMEGFERTVKREATEKEEQASEEKQKINRLLNKVNHDKELLELTWVNLDDKRSSLKKILNPLLSREEKLESTENELENQESVTFNPRERREIEEKRWTIQTERRKLEEEKWVVEERILKIEEQIEANKKKYQNLLSEEDKLRKQLRDINEQVLLQEEILRQQRELKEAALRQEALKKAAEEKRKQEEAAARLAEAQKAEAEKKAAEERKQREEHLRAKAMKEQAEQQKRFEEMRKAEEERQKQEALKMKEAAAELTKKIEEATLAAKKDAAPPPPEPAAPAEPPQPPAEPQTPAVDTPPTINDQIAVEKERRQTLKELEEIERIKQENQAAIRAEREKRASETSVQTSSLIDKLKEEEGLLKPLRTLKDDLEKAMKDQPGNKTDKT